jgi:hypothetical protein
MLSDSHISEPKIIVGLHDSLNNSNLSWECERCGMPNFATTFFNSTIEPSNSFLTLDDEEGIQDSICKPSHQSSPIHRQTFKSKSSKIDSKESLSCSNNSPLSEGGL